MSTNQATPQHPIAYFVLVYAMSAPFWILGMFIGKSSLPDNIPMTDIGAALTPTIAAMILTYREGGVAGIKELLLRTVDFRRIGKCRWLITAVALFPLIYACTYFMMQRLGLPVPNTWHISPSLGAVFVLFLVAATAEELGYTAYETDALLIRMNALTASLVIGAFWALWHLPSMLYMGQAVELIVWGLIVTVAFRVISIWLYNNAGRSVFAVVLMHAVGNTARTGFPGGRSAYELGNGRVAYSLVILVAVMVVAFWGPRTLSLFAADWRSTPPADA